MRARLTLAVAGVILLLPLLALGPAAGPAGAAPDRSAFRGLGAWVSVYEYVPAFVASGPPPVLPRGIDDLAALGARTLYLQAAIDDPRARGLIVDRALVGSMLERAHARGLHVVAWYYPGLTNPAGDQARLDAILSFRSHGQRFDGVALDIESNDVPDVGLRNQRLVDLARHVHDRAGGRPVGGVVYPAVQLEVINGALWPGFPYRALAPAIDVWLPMTYWTYRTGTYHDAFTYTDESIQRLRTDLRDPHVAVAPIGGLAGYATIADDVGFLRAARAEHALGWSLFSAATTATGAWPYLRAG